MNNIIWYDRPSSKMRLTPYKGWVSDAENLWQQTVLPIGAGDLGAAFYGETDVERVIINEKTLWTGGPSPNRNYTNGNVDGKAEQYKSLRDMLLQGKIEEASVELPKRLLGTNEGYGSYQVFGELKLDFGHKFEDCEKYIKKLDVDESIFTLKYKTDGKIYTREAFASNPHKVVALRLSAESGTLNFNLTYSPFERQAEVFTTSEGVIIQGALEDNARKFYSKLGVVCEGGKVGAAADKLTVSGAKECVIYIAAATDYKQEFPHYRTGESAEKLKKRVDAVIAQAQAAGYKKLKEAHERDYKALFGRVKLDLGGEKLPETTDKALDLYKFNALIPTHARQVEQLLFNFGRYLLISSSRADSLLPNNLQGIWSVTNSPPWESDYHTNINLQMNYWPAYTTNLIDCAAPLEDFIAAAVKPGQRTAELYTGEADSGFTTNTAMNPFGFTGVKNAENPDPWTACLWSPAAAAWLALTVYEGYKFNPDPALLSKLYPVLKQAAKYFDRILIEDNDGFLVTAPTYSPEHGPVTLGNTYEQTVVWHTYADAIDAGEKTGESAKLLDEWRGRLEKLRTVEIGKGGQVKEWYHEKRLGLFGRIPGGQFRHRHISHLLGLYPFSLICSKPEWVKGAVKSLCHRGDKSTGWAMGHRLNAWARTGNAKRAFKMIKQLFKTGVYPNMWDSHPPFQIDGNFGYTAGVAEMLVQSHMDYISLLPALPKEWEKGSVSGLLARGGYEITMEWDAGRVTELSVFSKFGGEVEIRANGSSYNVKTQAGKKCSVAL